MFVEGYPAQPKTTEETEDMLYGAGFNQFVAFNTCYVTWQEMAESAAKIYLEAKIINIINETK